MECVAVDMLGAPEVQRLRRIRQVGLVNLVFPGAEHSRFTHSLGAAHVMKRFANALVTATAGYLPKSLQPDEQAVRDLIVAALCHDIGHGPLSHAWEQRVIGDGYDAVTWRLALGIDAAMEERFPWLVRDKMKWHELVTQGLLLGKSELNEMLEAVEQGMAGRVAALLAGHFHLPYLSGAFASDVDADRCDFILRDAFQSGGSHGRYDLDWLVSTIAVGAKNDGDGDPVLGFDAQKSPKVIEQLLVARRALYSIVYRHPAVRAAEGMVGKMFELAKDSEAAVKAVANDPTFEPFAKAMRGETLGISEIGRLDDDALAIFLRRVSESVDENEPIHRIHEMLRRRTLFKPVDLKQHELTQLALEQDSGDERWNRIDAVLRRRGYDPPASFRFIDEFTFNFFHQGPPAEGSWLIDQRGRKGRVATPVRQESSLLHRDERSTTVFLFVPPDAAGPIADAWSSR